MKIYVLLIILLLYYTQTTFSQILQDFPCYAVSSGELPNVLFEYDPIKKEWTEVGVTGGTSIEAIAFDPVNNILYAVDGGIFGTIDANTGLFNPIGEVGTGNGRAGLIELNDIKGLTFDPINQIMYATHRIEGFERGKNDLLFQIDVATGQVIPDAMPAWNNGTLDYTRIWNIEIGTDYVYFNDTGDIAYHTYTGKLFAVKLKDESAALVTLDPLNGYVREVYFLDDDNVVGLGAGYLGELFGTIGNSSSNANSSNTFIFIEPIIFYEASTTTLNFVDPSKQHTNFEAVDCFTAYNDLALKMEVDPPTEQSINVGSTVSFQITIYNQGDFRNSNISLTNYIPQGLILADNNWTDLGNGKATHTITEVLEPGETASASITFLVNQNFMGDTIINTTEISASFSPDIIDVQGNRYTKPLPDLDSQADNQNNEVDIADNELEGGGPNAIQHKDEDDHDIGVIQVQSFKLAVNPELCDEFGSAQLEIFYSEASPFTYEWKDSNGSVINEGFTNDPVFEIYNMASGKYTVTVSDKFKQTNTFELNIALLSELDGNENCDNPCPKYLVVPEGEVSGNFNASEIIEIKGAVEKTKTAVFEICE